MNYSIRFNSLNELCKYLDNTPPRKVWYNENLGGTGYASIEGTNKFTGTESMEEARALLSGGWVDGLNMLAPLLRVPAHYQQTKKTRTILGRVGGCVAIPAYCAGSDKCFYSIKRNSAGRVVDIVYNCAVDCGVTTKEISEQAAKVYNIIRSIESAGTRCNLWVVEFVEKHSKKSYIATKIKDAGEAFSVLKYAFCVIHPSFLRRLMLAVQERYLPVKLKNYGCAMSSKSNAKEFAEGLKLLHINTAPGKVLDYYQLCELSENQVLEKLLAD